MRNEMGKKASVFRGPHTWIEINLSLFSNLQSFFLSVAIFSCAKHMKKNLSKWLTQMVDELTSAFIEFYFALKFPQKSDLIRRNRSQRGIGINTKLIRWTTGELIQITSIKRLFIRTKFELLKKTEKLFFVLLNGKEKFINWQRI